METDKGIVDLGFIYPTEYQIIKFLDKIYSIPFDNSKAWEKEIYSFFKETPFLIYYIERSLEDNFDYLTERMKFIMNDMNGNHKRIVLIDTEDIYQSLCKMRESVKIDKKLLKKKYLDYLFSNSIFFRRTCAKVVDSEDSLFNNFKTILYPSQSVLKYDNDIQVYESIFLFSSDGSIDYDYNNISEKLSNEFSKKIVALKNKIDNKNNPNRKRDPLDSRLRHECFKRDNYTCKECGATNKEKMLHADHILPVSQGGADELSNLQTLCIDCNLAKSNKTFTGGLQNG